MPLLTLAACRGTPERAAAIQAPGAEESGAQAEVPLVWTPPPPPQSTTRDWIRLVSGEWLRGEIRSLHRHTLEFESDELDTFTLDWEDVKEVRTGRPFSVLRTDSTTITGVVNVIDDRFVITNADGEFHMTRASVTRMVLGSPREIDNWDGKLSLGSTYRRGNTNQFDATSRIEILRRTANSRIDLSFVGSYTEINDTVTTDNERFNGKHDLFAGPRLFFTTFALEVYRDPFQNIEWRVVPATGLGYAVIDESRVELDVTAGIGYRFTEFSSVGVGDAESDGNTNGLLGTSFRSDLTKKLELTFDYTAQIGLNDLDDTNQNATIIFSFDVWKDLDFDLTFVWSRVGQPQADENGNVPQNDDYRLGFAIGWEF